MKVAFINSVFYGSTGRIIQDISSLVSEQGGDYIIFSGYCKKPLNDKKHFIIGNRFSKIIDIILSFFSGNELHFSFFATKKLLKKLSLFKPDLIHLNNLHNNYLNIKLLFSYIKKHEIPVVWTLHDCWAITGHCPHFTLEKCDKWITQCLKCPKYHFYPASLFDNSKKMWLFKKKWFTYLDYVDIVTPSVWLSNIVSKSYLQKYPVVVINNGIDVSVFKPTNHITIASRYKLNDKHIVLGVAYGWGPRKGLDVFIELAKELPDNYQIILVGTNNSIDKLLPANIISIHRTTSQKELAEFYSIADVFVNPTREEVLGLVNIESLACGTPVITFNTGGSPECIDETCGSVVGYDNIQDLKNEIIRVCNTHPFNRQDCINRAATFDKSTKYSEYYSLFLNICNNNRKKEL